MIKKVDNPLITVLACFILTLPISLIIWPLLDLLICAIFTHSDFHYTFNDYVVEPLIFSVIFTLIFYLPPILKARKKK